MVLPEKHLHRVEREGFSFVGLWKTYVLNSSLATILIPSASRSGFGKEYFNVGCFSQPPFIIIHALY
jgi:hypothetical protein